MLPELQVWRYFFDAILFGATLSYFFEAILRAFFKELHNPKSLLSRYFPRVAFS